MDKHWRLWICILSERLIGFVATSRLKSPSHETAGGRIIWAFEDHALFGRLATPTARGTLMTCPGILTTCTSR